MSKTEIDYLDENPEFTLRFDRSTKEFKQLWWVVSFVSPETVKNTTLRLVKCHGVFELEKDARQHAEDMRDINPHFDIFVGEVGKWLGFDPSWDSCKDVIYKEKEMQEFMKTTLESKEKEKNAEAKRVMEERNKQIKERIDQSKKSIYNTDSKKINESKKRIEEKLLNKKKNESSNDGEELISIEKEEIIKPENVKITTSNKKDQIDESIEQLEKTFAKMKN